jgi:dTDP-4-dehydrorhamnose 3,5-epimerase-like enzyme
MFSRISSEVHLSAKRTALGVIDLSNLPFTAKRLYWISDMSPLEIRGFHAHKKLNQVMIVVHGAIRLKLCRGKTEFTLEIEENDSHIIIPFGTWREITPLTKGATILVIADREYEEDDYIRDWNRYLSWFESNIHES